MKIAILNDTHAGVRGDMIEMAKYQGRFYEEVFFAKYLSILICYE